MPFFSVIIPVFNRYQIVKHAIDSALDQTFQDFELIVVDDGSTDGSPALEKEYHGRIVYIRQEHAGVSSARNAGLSIASSPYIAFLDSDDRWIPVKLERHAIYLREHPLVKIHQSNEAWIRNGRRANPRLKHLKKEGRIFADSLKLCLISPSAVVMSRRLFDQYGQFDPELPVCEDYDLWLRITLEEWVGLLSEQLVIKYGGHQDQLSFKYWGMDRFRVYSILKLLRNHSSTMNPLHKTQAINTALEKTLILQKGAIKRKKQEFAQRLQEIILMLNNGHYNADAYRCLLEQ